MSELNQPMQDLTVKGESVERIYGNYVDKRYIVNRRYQRKLVWTQEEKIGFIDSIINGYPVPIILLADKKADISNKIEIIDGMQRLNSIMCYLENEYPVNGFFFDLNTMASTKQQLDSGELIQKEPILNRETCVRVASYTVPISVYEFTEMSNVDEVFRRINSGGKKLSRQELRIAGSTGHFAQAVRNISAKVRGDVSNTDELLLNEMKKISITNRDLPYGINVDDIFWVKQGVLTKEQVRESRDEEIVADMLAFMLLDEKLSSRTEYLDDYFGFNNEEASRSRFDLVEVATQRYGSEIIALDFQRVLDQIKIILDRSQLSLGQLLFGTQPPRAPRYFQVIFLALHKKIVTENMEISDQDELIRLIRGSGTTITIPEGGRWGSEDRTNMVNATAGVFSPAFRPSRTYDPAQVRWINQLENILRQSYTEQAAYDFKQGFIRLDGSNTFDDSSFEKILKTLSAIANIKKGTKGYILVGVSEVKGDSRRIYELFKNESKIFENFFITGIEHEATIVKKTLDQYFQLITSKVKSSVISDPLKEYIVRNIKLVRYYDKSIFVFESCAQVDPSSYDGKYYIRSGNELNEIQSEKYGELFRRYTAGL